MALTSETLAEFREFMSDPNMAAEMAKAAGITSASGLNYYDLAAPSDKMIPLQTPLRNHIPRVKGKGGEAHRWRMIKSLDKSVHPGLGEGNRGGTLSVEVFPMMSAYAHLGLDSFCTWEARQQSEGYEDVRALAVDRGVQSLQQMEEYQLLGGAQSFKLGKGKAITATASATAGSLGAHEYVISCVPLNLWAFQHTTVGATGIVQSFSRANAGPSSSETINGGCGIASDEVAITLVADTAIDVIAAATPGASGYAWYIGQTGGQASKLVKITTVSKTTLTALPAAGNQSLSALVVADYSVNDQTSNGCTVLEANGLMAYLSDYQNNGMFWKDAAGASLATDGNNGVDMISEAFLSFYQNYKVSPSDCWVNATQAVQIAKIVTAGNNSIVRINTSGAGEKLVGGYQIPDILNPLLNTSLKINVHPDMPAGTVLFSSDTIQSQIQSLEAGPWCVREQLPMFGLEFPMTSRKHEMGIFSSWGLELHAPFAFGGIQNLV